MLGWTGDNGDPDNFLANLLGCDSAKTNGSNVAKFCYQPYEDLIQKAKTATARPSAQKLYEQAQVIFKEQAPWFTIAHAVQLEAGAQGSDRLQAVAVPAATRSTASTSRNDGFRATRERFPRPGFHRSDPRG